jgi:nicotinamide-nucleotide amidase
VNAAAIHERLAAAGATVAVAESLTGGLVSAALTETPGASATFRGGLVVYATDLKAALAGVGPALLAARGPVCAEVAEQLAVGAAERLQADYGVGITGVAGPEPQHGVPVGTVFVSVVGPGGATVTRLMLSGYRGSIRRQAVAGALAALGERLAAR